MLITIRKADNKLMSWNEGNTNNDPTLEELDVVQDYLPEGDFSRMFWHKDKKEIFVNESYIDPMIRKREILQEFKIIDEKKVRPLTAIALKTNTVEDDELLASLEAKAEVLRQELKALD